MGLVFNKIENGDVFTRDFNPLTRNNQIDFPTTEEIAVIYGPNGTGKTSLIKVLSDTPNTKLEFVYDGTAYTSGANVFHVVNDQNNRNIISGETRDFFLGDNIQHEFELQDLLAEKRAAFISAVLSILKGYKITTTKHPLSDLIEDESLRGFVKNCANNKSKGDQYTNEQIVNMMTALGRATVPDYDQACLNYLVEDYSKKKPVIAQIEALAGETLAPNMHVREIEENTEAIAILSRFHKDQCIVCDTRGIDWEALLAAKTANRDTVKEALDPKIKELLEEITNLSFGADPFNLRARLLQTIEDGDMTIVADILAEIAVYKHIFAIVLQNAIIDAYEQGDITATFHEYHELISTTPDISQEDYLYIQEIVSNSMSKRLSVERDENRRLRIRLSNQDFLGLPRDELPLSTGEQNFLSLTFEFLKAKNSAAPIVVIDDPVSSFDSIYKNKVVYAIVRILHHKKRIVLTHNTDLIRLLDGQYKHCFKLYLLNNTDGEVNGFIPLRNREQDMLISLEKLLEAFRNDVPRNVQNFELYLISMIPFMRGYANIANKRDIFENLTQVMHGYKTESVDIAQAYIELFGNPDGLIQAPYNVTVSDILLKSVDAVTIVDTNYFPLLNRTLKHSFQYLFLRLAVEKALVDKFNIDTTRYTQLGQIISAAFPDDNDIGQIRDRIRLTSKKTLINEFNHFEGNLSIFQPAIDITDQALSTEKANLMTFIENL
mgnify:CR=1 FL=1